MTRIIVGMLVAASLAAQVLVVDRGLDRQTMAAQAVERGRQGSYADDFRIGREGEVWMIDAVRVWAMPGASPGCSGELGGQVDKIQLFGALDNPPIPGQPVCDCHALVAVSSAQLAPGKPFSVPVSLNPGVLLAPEGGTLRIDFQNVRWSVPGAADVLFTVRVSPRRPQTCRADEAWALAASPAAGHRLHLLNQKGVPVGQETLRSQPQAFHVQVWARRTSAK